MTGECLSPDLSFADFKQIADQISGSGLIPVTITIPLPEASPADLYQFLRTPYGFLLESMEGVPRRAVRSIIGTGIAELLILDEKNGLSGDPIEQIRRFMETHQLCGKAPAGFAGGLVGYCSYDMVSDLNQGYLDAGREEHCPIGKFMVANSGVVLDHVKKTCIIFASPKVGPGDNIRRIYDDAVTQVISQASQILQVKADTALDQPAHHTEEVLLTSPISKEAFESAVEKTLEHIRAGDIFQAVISRRFNAPYTGDPFRIYKEVRQLNPSPYLYFLEFGDETVIGSSPEMLVKVDGEDIFTVPIAGTRPRGADPAEDARLAEEMLADEKEKAEHLMLVDLARNDIGKVASFGSVRVSSFMEVEKFSHVQHLTSQVTGKLATGSDRFDVLGSCFPAGTVSGAPKLRAMQIISGLEPHARGLYAGAVGYIGFDDRLEFAIAIRTAIVRDGVVSFQTGAGIVADSNPEREYEETRQKAGAMLAALSRACAHEITSQDQKKAGGIA